MRITRLALRGIGPFRDLAHVDLDTIPGRLIAVTGPNGAGKSTLAESILGAIDRQTPTRGPLTDLATTRDAFVEVDIEAAGTYRIRQLVDGVARKGETLLTNGTGAPVLADSKVTTWDEWRRAHLPPTSVLLSTVFAAQSSGGFLDLSTADRKAVMNRTLGIEGLEALAERARENARGAKSRVDALSDRVRSERERFDGIENAEDFLQYTRGVAIAKDGDLRIAKEALADAKARHATLVAAWEDAEAARKKRSEAKRKADEAQSEVERVSARLQAAEQTLTDADRVRDAAEKLQSNRAEYDLAKDRRREVETRLAETEAALRRLNDELSSAQDAYAAAKKRVDAADDARRDLQQARYVAATVKSKSESVQRLERERDAAAVLLEEVSAKTTAGKDERIDGLRDGLEKIHDEHPIVRDARDFAREVIEADDDLAKSEADIRQAIDAARYAKDAAHKAHLEAFYELQEMEKKAARVPDLERAVADANEAERDMTKARTLQEQLQNQRGPLETRRQVQRSQADEHQAVIDELGREAAELTPIAARLQDVIAAEARLDEIRRAETTADAALVEAKRALDACPEPPDTEPVPDVSAQEKAVEAAEADARDAHAAVAVAQKGLNDARAAAQRIEGMERDVAQLEEELADWTRLGTDLGAKGVVAYLIDAAGPEISEIATSLLHECFGPRWTVSLQTTRPSADGKRDIETFSVNVLDTEAGRDGEALGLSGGERVIVGEALSLALTTVACRRAGFHRPTLVRDESGAALDPERARAYVAMLRRAAELIGADKVLIVSHSTEVVDLCDARIEIADGGVTVAA